MLRINLGGEGEVAGVLNQNGPWIAEPVWVSSHLRKTLWELVQDGHEFLICSNLRLPFPDESVDEVYANAIPPLDAVTYLGPGVQSSEIERILKSGGVLLKDGHVEFVKP